MFTGDQVVITLNHIPQQCNQVNVLSLETPKLKIMETMISSWPPLTSMEQEPSPSNIIRLTIKIRNGSGMSLTDQSTIMPSQNSTWPPMIATTDFLLCKERRVVKHPPDNSTSITKKINSWPVRDMHSQSIMKHNTSAINQTLVEPLNHGTSNTAKVRKKLSHQRRWD